MWVLYGLCCVITLVFCLVWMFGLVWITGLRFGMLFLFGLPCVWLFIVCVNNVGFWVVWLGVFCYGWLRCRFAFRVIGFRFVFVCGLFAYVGFYSFVVMQLLMISVFCLRACLGRLLTIDILVLLFDCCCVFGFGFDLSLFEFRLGVEFAITMGLVFFGGGFFWGGFVPYCVTCV